MFTSTIPVQATQCMGTYTVTKGGRWFEGAQQLLLVTLNCCIEYVPCISAVHYSDVHGESYGTSVILSILGRTITTAEVYCGHKSA